MGRGLVEFPPLLFVQDCRGISRGDVNKSSRTERGVGVVLRRRQFSMYSFLTTKVWISPSALKRRRVFGIEAACTDAGLGAGDTEDMNMVSFCSFEGNLPQFSMGGLEERYKEGEGV